MNEASSVVWPVPEKSDCTFYHSMDFPDGDSVTGVWDIRGKLEQYLGGYPLKGQTVLDVGTASGFVAFEAEKAGAAAVTATDLEQYWQGSFLPFIELPYQSGDLLKWQIEVEPGWKKLKNAFWYGWHKNNSKVEMVYATINDLRYWNRQFDVVIAGALLEHVSDPVTAIGAFTKLAKKAVIIAFTPMEYTSDLLVRPITNLKSRDNFYTWWSLSRGLYRQIFDNCGFNIKVSEAVAFNNQIGAFGKRPTIVATRK